MQNHMYFHHFTIKRKINYGKAIYIIGNTSILGQWNI